MDIKLPEKPRKHKWVTEALAAGDNKLSVWPSPDDFKTDSKKKQFLETIAKIGNDPRVTNVNKFDDDEHVVVYVFDLVE